MTTPRVGGYESIETPITASPLRATQMRSSCSPGERIHFMKSSKVNLVTGAVVGMSRMASPVICQTFFHFSGSVSRSTVSTRIFSSRIFARDSATIASSFPRCATRSSSQKRWRRSSRYPRFVRTPTRSASSSHDQAVKVFVPSERERSSIAMKSASMRAGVRCEGMRSPETLP